MFAGFALGRGAGIGDDRAQLTRGRSDSSEAASIVAGLILAFAITQTERTAAGAVLQS